MDAKRMIFNSSLPRAGSTLLQNILAQNPSFYCSPTSGVLDLLFTARNTFSNTAHFKAQDANTMRDGWLGFCRSGLNGFYQAITAKPVCVDKNRMWLHFYEWLEAFWPNPKILICVRDLRALLSSMEKLFRQHRYLEDPQDAQGIQMTTITNRVAFWLNHNQVGNSLLALMEALQTGTIQHAHLIRFEDLTSDPAATMKKVYAYLNEPEFPHDFDHVQQITREDDTFHGIYGDHQIRAKVAPVKLDYNEVLGRELCEQLKADNLDFYRAFYPNKI